jgi:hypothetical protein
VTEEPGHIVLRSIRRRRLQLAYESGALPAAQIRESRPPLFGRAEAMEGVTRLRRRRSTTRRRAAPGPCENGSV